MGYNLKGRMAELCTCQSVCPCVMALAPDNNVCEFSWVFQLDEGTVGTVEVSGLRLGVLGRLDGSPVDGSARAAIFVDDRASDEQEAAILQAFTGELGGPLADIASLISEVVTVTRAAIDLEVDKGTGRFQIGDRAKGGMESLRGADGEPSKVVDFALAPLGHVDYPGLPTDFEINAADLGFTFRPNSSSSFEFHHVVA